MGNAGNSRAGPCMCGATDCPSCGPAQGYRVERRKVRGRVAFVNSDDDDDDDDDETVALDADGIDLDDEPDEHAADLACDRWERGIDARHA